MQPDPLHPKLDNGDFEEIIGKPPQPVGWHYVRQLTVVSDGEAPSGKNYVTFRNREPGRGCQALQGFAVDGRKVAQLDVSLVVRGRDIRAGQTPEELPMLVITFYGENRAACARRGSWGPGSAASTGRPRGSGSPFPSAREAVLRVGLLGAVGELSVDNVELRAVPKK